MEIVAAISAILLIILAVAKPIFYRGIAIKYKSSFSSTFTASWVVVFIILSLPFFSEDLLFGLTAIYNHPYLLLLDILKGVVVWYSVKYTQLVNRYSTSSSVYLSFISLGLAVFMLNVFLGENLGLMRLISIVLLGILGFSFFVFGAARNLDWKQKKYCFTAVILAASCPLIDYKAIFEQGWYAYLATSNVFMLLFSIIKEKKLPDFKLIFLSPKVVKAGLVNTLLEIVIIGSSIRILPISMISFYKRLAAPIVMVFSAIKYKESTVYNQFIFGVITLIAALPIILLN